MWTLILGFAAGAEEAWRELWPQLFPPSSQNLLSTKFSAKKASKKLIYTGLFSV